MSVEFWHNVELRNSKDGYLSVLNRSVPGARSHPVLVAETFGNGDASAEFLAARLAACWNAMLGIPDPAAFMEEVRELCELAGFALDQFDELVNRHYGGDIPCTDEDLIKLDTLRALLSKLSGGV